MFLHHFHQCFTHSYHINIMLKLYKNLSLTKNLVRCVCTKPEVTALYDYHLEHGGKLVNFGGFLLPVQYQDQSIVNSHLFTRKNASVFDVSHMLQTEIRGKDVVGYMEKLCTADLTNLKENSSVLTVFTNETGGILDDLIITKVAEDHLYVVSNAARKQHDQEHLLKALDPHKHQDVTLKFYNPSDLGLIALQGPKSHQILQKLTSHDLTTLFFMTSCTTTVANIPNCRITRCGYTGEDGFEISMPASKTPEITSNILQEAGVKLAGLGARDSLRLEAGLCLYGNDITDKTTPVEAGLTWLVAKKRRELGDFPGASVILKQIAEGAGRKRVGLVAEDGPPARQGAEIVDENGKVLGCITSGCPSPTLSKNIAMGYVPTEYSKTGTKVAVKIRNKIYEATVSKMPFVKANYYNKPKSK